MGDDLTLDGNGLAGLLSEVLAADPSTMVRTCGSCGERHALGEHRGYRGAGVVLRCPGCGDAAVLIGVHDTSFTVKARGTFTVARVV
jgi:hypothetical protein